MHIVAITLGTLCKLNGKYCVSYIMQFTCTSWYTKNDTEFATPDI